MVVKPYRHDLESYFYFEATLFYKDLFLIVVLFKLKSFFFLVKVEIALFKLETFIFQGVAIFYLESMRST